MILASAARPPPSEPHPCRFAHNHVVVKNRGLKSLFQNRRVRKHSFPRETVGINRWPIVGVQIHKNTRRLREEDVQGSARPQWYAGRGGRWPATPRLGTAVGLGVIWFTHIGTGVCLNASASHCRCAWVGVCGGLCSSMFVCRCVLVLVGPSPHRGLTIPAAWLARYAFRCKSPSAERVITHGRPGKRNGCEKTCVEDEMRMLTSFWLDREKSFKLILVCEDSSVKRNPHSHKTYQVSPPEGPCCGRLASLKVGEALKTIHA